MIDLYYWPTPNGWKISIMLEETGLDYNLKLVNIGQGDQFKPAFLAISPNNRMPAIVDHEAEGGPLSIFESGAILTYLAEKTGKFFPSDALGRNDVLQWLMFQMGGVGPMFGQNHHFRRAAPEEVPYALERYAKETARLYGVLDKRLGQTEYLGGEYSIADIATYPWTARHEWHKTDLNDFPNVKRWFEVIASRPAVAKGMAVPFLN